MEAEGVAYFFQNGGLPALVAAFVVVLTLAGERFIKLWGSWKTVQQESKNAKIDMDEKRQALNLSAQNDLMKQIDLQVEFFKKQVAYLQETIDSLRQDLDKERERNEVLASALSRERMRSASLREVVDLTPVSSEAVPST